MPQRRHCLTPMLAVGDLSKTIEFYQAALGLFVSCTFENDGRIVWAEFSSSQRWFLCEGPVLMCNEVPQSAQATPEERRAKKGMILYLYPFDVAKLHAELVQKGFAPGDLRVTVYGMKEFELEDPDGYQLWFGQATDDAPTVRE